MSKRAKEKNEKAVRMVQARLIEQGSNLRRFAITNGYLPRTVSQTVYRWAGQQGEPRGRLTYKILNDLSKTVGYEIIKGPLETDKETMHE